MQKMILLSLILHITVAFSQNIGKMGLRQIPKVYNALITTNENLTTSQAYPLLQPTLYATKFFNYPAFPVNQVVAFPPPAAFPPHLLPPRPPPLFTPPFLQVQPNPDASETSQKNSSQVMGDTNSSPEAKENQPFSPPIYRLPIPLSVPLQSIRPIGPNLIPQFPVPPHVFHPINPWFSSGFGGLHPHFPPQPIPIVPSNKQDPSPSSPPSKDSDKNDMEKKFNDAEEFPTKEDEPSAEGTDPEPPKNDPEQPESSKGE